MPPPPPKKEGSKVKKPNSAKKKKKMRGLDIIRRDNIVLYVWFIIFIKEKSLSPA